MFYMQENPKGSKHSGYRGLAIENLPQEDVLDAQDVIDSFEDEDQHALASEIAILADLFDNNGEITESVANTLRLLSEHPSSMLLKLLERKDARSRAAIIRMLSIPSLNSLPIEQFLDIDDWMHQHPEDAWRWAMALENIDVEFPWTEDEFGEDELEQLAEIWNDVVGLPKPDFVAKYASDADEAWMEMHGRIPRISYLREIEPETVASISLKDLMRALKNPEISELNDEIAAKGAVGLANVFGSRWPDWLKAMSRQKINVHDSIFWLPTTPSPGLGDFLFANRNRPINTLSMIASAWNEIPQELIDEGVEAAKSFVQAREYENVEVPELARIAARFGYAPYKYAEIEEAWLRLLKSGDTIPDIVVEHNGFTMYKLKPNDPRGIFLGKFTTCCQAPGEIGRGAAWYGHSHPDSAFYVFENEDGKILAQSWVWQNDGYYVFDNWEGKGIISNRYRDTLFAMFQKVAEEMVNKHGAVEVRVGDTMDYDGKLIHLPWEYGRDDDGSPRPVTAPYDLMFNNYYTNDQGGYTDCPEYQSVVARSKNAPPYYEPSDETKEGVTTGLRQIFSLTKNEREYKSIIWGSGRAMTQNILSSNVPADFIADDEINPDYQWEGFDGYFYLSGKVSLFVGVGVVYEIKENLRAVFETDTNTIYIVRANFLDFDYDYEEILDDFFTGIYTKMMDGYPDLDQDLSIEDSPIFYDDLEIPSPFEVPPIELDIDPEYARYALWIDRTSIGNMVQDHNGEMVFYYKTKGQLTDAIQVYDPIGHLIGRDRNAVLVKSSPGVISFVDTDDKQGFGEWVVDEMLTESLLLKMP